ncbi:adenine phosphoribosyltransferase [Helicobacter aurati]|uniref:Adenine phosphoribosyltransferase n=1 Tax=Helicobacter aurati TaxID=137778 RepID=A0A3D8J165_9HELI|nr:adenine phosphoribosyltransferase [Helicobacter aurati]RDU71279.1 adenine phosphoribosyltransferase [Helicobacter aurati]
MAKHKPTLREEIQCSIAQVQDFPKKGIIFQDITTFIHNGKLFKEYIDMLAHRYHAYKVEYIAGIEARGFIIGAALAFALGAGFVPIRKRSKLPGKVFTESYSLEYGNDHLEIKEDAFSGLKGVNVILVDDLIATAGTAKAAIKLIKRLEARCLELCCLINLMEFAETKDRKEIEKEVHLFSLIEIDAE